MYGWENSRNLSETETPLRVCVTVTNSTNTPRAYCVKKHVYHLSETETPLRVCVTVTNSTNTPRAYCVKKHVYRPCSFTKCMCKMSLKAIEKLLNKVFFH